MINVLILTWNGLSLLQDLYPTLISNLSETNTEFQIYVRSNGCSDGSKDWLFSQPHINMLDVSHNRDSFSTGMNSLATMAKNAETTKDSDYFLFVNNDIIFQDEKSIKNLLELQINSNAGVVGGRLMYPNGKVQYCGTIFSAKYNNMPWHFRTGEELDDNMKKNRWFQAMTGALMLIPCPVFFEINGFDENLKWAFDDVALCLNIGKRHKIAYCGSTEVLHKESVSLKKNGYNKLYLNENVKYFKEKYKYKIDHDLYLNDKNHNLI